MTIFMSELMSRGRRFVVSSLDSRPMRNSDHERREFDCFDE